MSKLSNLFTTALATLICSLAFSQTYVRVDADLKIYDDVVASKIVEFNKNPANPNDKNWVTAKLAHMADIDQYMRKYMNTPYQQQYSAEESKYFQKEFGVRQGNIDTANTADLKSLLQVYEWFTISLFGERADHNAWLIVQHADLDVNFQKHVLTILEKLFRVGETDPSNYAYLFDRVAYSDNDPTLRKPQRYGTQGKCVKPGTWEPFEVEDPANLDNRRKEVGLEPMADYIKRFVKLCH